MLTIDRLNCTLDFEQDGKHFGNIDLGYSDNQHAFAKIPVPLVCIKNGSGPTLLLSAGNHGDEYEGQVILRRLIHQLQAEDIQGRLILLPALNYPAMLDNVRISPLDQGNMNRSFPGTEGGTPTAAIAHFVTTHLLPLADAGIDLHSGGLTACYVPMAFLCTSEDAVMTQRNLDLIDAFNAPLTFVVDGRGSPNGFDSIANQAGVPFISTELGGGGNIDTKANRIGWRGVQNVMRHLGIIDGDPQRNHSNCFLNGIDGSGYLSAPYSGIFEPVCQLGDRVNAGDVAGWLYATEEVDRAPLELQFEHSGIVIAQNNGARVMRGSHLLLVASEIQRDDILE